MLRNPVAILLGILPAIAFADVVHFENGDRLTGTVVDVEAGFVAVDVPGIGRVKSPENLVARVERDATVVPDTPDEKPTGLVGWIDPWDVTIDVAMTTASGNSETADFNVVAGAKRTGQRFDHVMGASWHRGEADDALARDQIEMDYDLRWKRGETWYALANVAYFRDPLKGVDHRATAGLGVGYTLWASPAGGATTDAGVTQIFERLDDPSIGTDDNPALRWTLGYQQWLVAKRLELLSRHEVLHVLASERGTLWDGDASLRLHLGGVWHAGLRLDLRHETEPPVGRGRTDVGYALSLAAKF